MINIDEDGTIFLYQGDSGEITVYGLDEKKNYTICFAIQDSSRKVIGEELKVVVSNSDTATFVLTPSYTNLLTVPKNKPYKIYFYGIKACINETGDEDTLFISDSTYGDLNRVIVYPQKVKGETNGTK